jgi:cytochrome c-type biogenesis protein CcmE
MARTVCRSPTPVCCPTCFRADTVLAKHDENYMPPEAAAALKAAKGSTQ